MNGLITGAMVLLGLIALVLVLSGEARVMRRGRGGALVDRVDEVLPQTQCRECGYPGCRPYAAAIVFDHEAINLCPPGGDATVRALAEMLGEEYLPIARAQNVQRKIARIDEDVCIGCTKCIQACPVDAIVGASRQMHSVLEQQCTGCELCILPCPVDCIDLVDVSQTAAGWRWPLPEGAVR